MANQRGKKDVEVAKTDFESQTSAELAVGNDLPGLGRDSLHTTVKS